MPKIFKRHCDTCGEYYEGFGERYCGLECSYEMKRRWEESPQEPDERIVLEPEGDEFNVTVAASLSIRSPEALFEHSGLDPETWEIAPDSASVRKWDVVIKQADGDPLVVPAYYVGIKARKKWEETDLPRPIILSINRPSKQKPSAGAFTSVHYGDLHIPHHDPRATDILYQILDTVKPDLVVDHGDTLDCEQISKYPKDPYNRISLDVEIQMGARHLGTVHSLTPNAEHIWLAGNHEDRLRRTIWGLAENRVAGELLQLPQLREAMSWPSLLGIGELGWQTYGYTGSGEKAHHLLFDRLILKHGDVVRKDSAASARAECLKYNKSGMSGHTHRQGVYHHRDYNGQLAWWELGMLGRIREDYVAHADWQQGLAVVSWSEDRKRFGVELVAIHDGVAFWRGERYEGREECQLAA